MIEPTYDIGDMVYIKTDIDQHQRIVTAIIVCPAKDLLYELCCGTVSSKHYDFELSKEKNYVQQ
jgi:hypothetical protein